MTFTIYWWVLPVLIGVAGTIFSFIWAGRGSGGYLDLSGVFGCIFSLAFWVIALMLALWLKP